MKVICIKANQCDRKDCFHHKPHTPLRMLSADCDCTQDTECPVIKEPTHCGGSPDETKD